MGIEHPQLDAVKALFTGKPADFASAADLISPGGKTPNQRALACAIALAWARQRDDKIAKVSRPDAAAQTRELFQAMATFGHQAVGPTYGCEEGAPDPHSALWLGALATILREARLQAIDDLLDSAICYFANHVAMCRAFWTPAGVRMPCSRAKAVGQQPLRPNWTEDSVAYANLCGLPTTGLAKPQDQQVLQVLQDSASLFPQIVERSKTEALKLAVPIRRWECEGGGFVAAMVKDVPMNDRCSWLIVDGAGTILQADKTLSSFTTPEGDPVVIGGGAAVPSEPPGSPGPSPEPPGSDLAALAAQVRSLRLARSQGALKERAAQAIEAGRLAEALPLVRAFGIGPGQAQAVTWRSILAALGDKSPHAEA